MIDTELRTQGQPLGPHIGDSDLTAPEFREQGTGDPDRTTPTDQDALLRSDSTAPYGVGSDREKFDHGRIVERYAVRREHKSLGQTNILRECAVPVNTKYLDGRAAVRPALATGTASAA